MRGNVFTMTQPTVDSVDVAETATQPEANTNLAENMKPAKTGSVWFWVAILGIYLVWDWIQNREPVREAIEPTNIRANVHNLAVIGIGAVIFINGANVLLTKLASMRIPVISKAAGSLLPLFQL